MSSRQAQAIYWDPIKKIKSSCLGAEENLGLGKSWNEDKGKFWAVSEILSMNRILNEVSLDF